MSDIGFGVGVIDRIEGEYAVTEFTEGEKIFMVNIPLVLLHNPKEGDFVKIVSGYIIM
jgi:hypothetical protein